MIPNKSEVNIIKGNWFIHKDGMNVIQVWSSNLNGKEKVFLNNELLSEKTSVKMNSSHVFKDKNGQNYEIIFEIQSLLTGSLKCLIKKEDLILKVFQTKYLIFGNFTLKRFLIAILASAIFGFIMGIFNLPNFTLIIFLFFVLTIYYKTSDKSYFLIEEH